MKRCRHGDSSTADKDSVESREDVEEEKNAGNRASWHGPLPEPEEPQGATGFTPRSYSQGNLQQKSRARPRLKFFKSKSYTVTPSPPSPPSKSASQSGLKSLFKNIKRSKKSKSDKGPTVADGESSNRRSVELAHSSSRTWSVTSTESDSSLPEIEPISASPHLDSDDEDLGKPVANSVHQTENVPRNQVDPEPENQVALQTRQRPNSELIEESSDTLNRSLTIPQRSNPHPIHTFQLTMRRSSGPRAPATLFGRARARKSVIVEVEENLTHPFILAILSVINFILWWFLFTVKVLGTAAYVSIWLWLRLLYIIDFIVKLFHRIFNQDPEKQTNQNTDYSHIESK